MELEQLWSQPGSVWHYLSVIQQVGQRGRRPPEVTRKLIERLHDNTETDGAFHSGRQMREYCMWCHMVPCCLHLDSLNVA